MSDMIEAAVPLRSKYAEEVSWPRYIASCGVALAVFCGMLWLAR